MNPADLSAIAHVAALRHRIGNERRCRCDECRDIKRVCALAREAVAMKAARRKRKNVTPRAVTLSVEQMLITWYYNHSGIDLRKL